MMWIVVIILLLFYVPNIGEFSSLLNSGWTLVAVANLRHMLRYAAPDIINARFAIWTRTPIAERCVIYATGGMQLHMPLVLFWGTAPGVLVSAAAETKKLDGARQYGTIVGNSLRISGADWTACVGAAAGFAAYSADTPSIMRGAATVEKYMLAHSAVC